MEVSEFIIKLLTIILSAKLFAEVRKRNSIFDDSLYAVVVFVVAVTTRLAPLALKPLMKNLPEECSV